MSRVKDCLKSDSDLKFTVSAGKSFHIGIILFTKVRWTTEYLAAKLTS